MINLGLKIGSLFSGIDGLGLGLEWAGIGKIIWQVEKDLYCNLVLTMHWPKVKRYNNYEAINLFYIRICDLDADGLAVFRWES